jgi:hypothetical protein
MMKGKWSSSWLTDLSSTHSKQPTNAGVSLIHHWKATPSVHIYQGKQCYEQKPCRKTKYTLAGMCLFGRSKSKLEVNIVLCLTHLRGYVIPQLCNLMEEESCVQWDLVYEDIVCSQWDPVTFWWKPNYLHESLGDVKWMTLAVNV